MDNWGTINEAAAYWKVSRATVQRWMRKGLVTVKRTPGGMPRVLLVEKASIDIHRILHPTPRRKK